MDRTTIQTDIAQFAIGELVQGLFRFGSPASGVVTGQETFKGVDEPVGGDGAEGRDVRVGSRRHDR